MPGLYCRSCGLMIKYSDCPNCNSSSEPNAKAYFAAPVQNITNNYADREERIVDIPVVKPEVTWSEKFFKTAFSLTCLGAGLIVLSAGCMCVLGLIVMVIGVAK